MVTFAAPITSSGASVNGGTVSNFSVAGSGAMIDLTGIANAETTTVRLDSVNDGANFGCVNLPLSTLLGDTNAHGAVTASDDSQMKAASNQPVTNANFRTDPTVNGTINTSDIGLVKAQSGTVVLP